MTSGRKILLAEALLASATPAGDTSPPTFGVVRVAVHSRSGADVGRVGGERPGLAQDRDGPRRQLEDVQLVPFPRRRSRRRGA